ncbi:MAG: hypothetical protein II610_06925 [Treponema sp.]|nr:hypothetical protein [Treponema sp.]
MATRVIAVLFFGLATEIVKSYPVIGLPPIFGQNGAQRRIDGLFFARKPPLDIYSAFL